MAAKVFWNLTPQLKYDTSCKIFLLSIKKSLYYFFSKVICKRLNFVQIIFYFEKNPEGILAHLRAYGVKFRTSLRLENLYVKMKLWTWAFQKNSSQGHPSEHSRFKTPEISNSGSSPVMSHRNRNSKEVPRTWLKIFKTQSRREILR